MPRKVELLPNTVVSWRVSNGGLRGNVGVWQSTVDESFNGGNTLRFACQMACANVRPHPYRNEHEQAVYFVLYIDSRGRPLTVDAFWWDRVQGLCSKWVCLAGREDLDFTFIMHGIN